LYYRTGESPPVAPMELSDYVTGPHYITAKQIPSALAVKRPGSFSVKKQVEILKEAGFPLIEGEMSGKTFMEFKPPLSEDLDSSEEDVLLKAFTSSSTNDSSSISEEDIIDENTDNYHRYVVRIAYEDPWKIISARAYMDDRGAKLPETRVWFADVLRLQDPLPPRLLGEGWRGSKRNKIRFQAINDPAVKFNVLIKHTHWGYFLNKLSYSETSSTRNWANMQKRRLKAFLFCKPDPRWQSSFREKFHTPGVNSERMKSRSNRLLEVLKTVDGMFCQRYLAFPQEKWTWNKYDMFILKNFFELLSDEFLDGELCAEALQLTTRYEELKNARGLFKKISHDYVRGTSGVVTDDLSAIATKLSSDLKLPDWLHQLQPLWSAAMMIKDPFLRNSRIGVLSQTRGCGTPPPLVVLKTKEKFLRTVTEKPIPLTDTEKRIVYGVCESVVLNIPDHAFTGLSTKARITVTSSACWEYTQKEGGTVQAISDLVALGKEGATAAIFNLETGAFEGRKAYGELHPGEYIFWRCLEYVLGKQREETYKVQLVAVKEPGKSRIVTKGSAYVKILLDVVNKLCSEPVKKGLETSSSGMGKSHHGWNFFRSFFERGKGGFIFEDPDIQDVKDGNVDDSFTRYTTYKQVFVSSTDYETATDYMHLEVASIIGNSWMSRCGIPRVLRAIVHQFCFRTRPIYFHASGCLKGVGVESEIPGVNLIQVERGIMMGDPLTKVILHLTNVMVREYSSKFDTIQIWMKIFPKDYPVIWENIQLLIKRSVPGY